MRKALPNWRQKVAVQSSGGVALWVLRLAETAYLLTGAGKSALTRGNPGSTRQDASHRQVGEIFHELAGHKESRIVEGLVMPDEAGNVASRLGRFTGYRAFEALTQ